MINEKQKKTIKYCAIAAGILTLAAIVQYEAASCPSVGCSTNPPYKKVLNVCVPC